MTLVTMFGSVLQPSSVRGLATPWTYFLRLSLSSVVLLDSSAGSPVHVLMLSIQAVRGHDNSTINIVVVVVIIIITAVLIFTRQRISPTLYDAVHSISSSPYAARRAPGQ